MKRLFVTILALSLPATFFSEYTFAQASKEPIMQASHSLASLFNSLSLLLRTEPQEDTIKQPLSEILDNVFNLIAETQDTKDLSFTTIVNNLHKDCRRKLDNIFTDITSSSATLDDCKHHHSTHEEKIAKAEASLYNIATIAAGVATIIQHPHDQPSIEHGVNTVLAGIINIALLTAHKPHANLP
jgi:hypothetical protein